MRSHRRPGLVLAVIAGLLATSACSEQATTEPEDAPFDAARARADVQAVQHVFAGDVWKSFAALAPRFTMEATPDAVVATVDGALALRAAAGDPGATRRAALSAARVLAARGARPAAALIPIDLLGTTFVFDAGRQAYVADPVRSGAPANGVRFILYAVDPVTHQPVNGAETGWVDLLDESGGRPTGMALRLRVVSGGTTYLDYGVSATGTATTGVLAVDGFLTDGTTRLSFDIDALARVDGSREALDVDFRFDVPDRGFSTVAHVDGARTDDHELGHVTMTIRFGDDTLDYDVEGEDDDLDARVLINGRLLATITGTTRNPIVRAGRGHDLTLHESAALGQIMGLIGSQFELLDALLRPVAG